MEDKLFLAVFDRHNEYYVFRIDAADKNEAKKKVTKFLDSRKDQLSKFGLRLIETIEPSQLPTLDKVGDSLDNYDNQEIVKDILT